MTAHHIKPAHWHVLGAGAMGCLFACALQRAGCPTTLLLRKHSGTSTETVRLEQGDCSIELQFPASAAGDDSPVSHLLVTTKAHQVQEAVLGVAHRLGRDSQLLLLSNGMGFADTLRNALRDDLPDSGFYFGTTTHGAYRISARHIRHAGQGLTRIGQPGTSDAPPWFSQWSQAVPGSRWDPEIEGALWLKLAINCAINPLTALHGCANGELASRPDLAAEVALLCEEIVRISAAAGFSAATRDLPSSVARVIADTADNRSSMLQDVQAGQRTEIEFITGYLLRVARQHAIAAPANESLYRRIADIDR